MPTGANPSYERDAERLNERAPDATGDAIVRTYGNAEKTKKCTKCGLTKNELDFGTRKGKHRKPGDRHAECKSCTAERRRNRYKNEPGFAQRASEAAKLSYNKVRSETIAAYGGKCACCGECNEFFLTFDHIHNNGAEHRRQIGDGGKYLVAWIKKQGYPDTIQLLCHNCNCAKGFYGICPHKSNRKRLAEMSSPVAA